MADLPDCTNHSGEGERYFDYSRIGLLYVGLTFVMVDMIIEKYIRCRPYVLLLYSGDFGRDGHRTLYGSKHTQLHNNANFAGLPILPFHHVCFIAQGQSVAFVRATTHY